MKHDYKTKYRWVRVLTEKEIKEKFGCIPEDFQWLIRSKFCNRQYRFYYYIGTMVRVIVYDGDYYHYGKTCFVDIPMRYVEMIEPISYEEWMRLVDVLDYVCYGNPYNCVLD